MYVCKLASLQRILCVHSFTQLLLYLVFVPPLLHFTSAATATNKEQKWKSKGKERTQDSSSSSSYIHKSVPVSDKCITYYIDSAAKANVALIRGVLSACTYGAQSMYTTAIGCLRSIWHHPTLTSDSSEVMLHDWWQQEKTKQSESNVTRAHFWGPLSCSELVCCRVQITIWGNAWNNELIIFY